MPLTRHCSYFDFSKMESAHYEGTRLYIVSTSKAMIRGLENDGWDRQELKADISSARCRRLHRLCAVWGTLYETCLQFKKMVLDICPRQTSPWSGCSTSWSLTRCQTWRGPAKYRVFSRMSLVSDRGGVQAVQDPVQTQVRRLERASCQQHGSSQRKKESGLVVTHIFRKAASAAVNVLKMRKKA